MERLVLTNNNINDADAILIARALEHNTNLRRLDLGQNDITNTGRSALAKALFDSTSLNHVTDMNHSCGIEGLDFAGILTNGYKDQKSNRSRKIFALLSARNRMGTKMFST